MVMTTLSPLVVTRWSESPAVQELHDTQLLRPWAKATACCRSKKAWKRRYVTRQKQAE